MLSTHYTVRFDVATQHLMEQAHPVAALFKPIDERILFDAITRALALSGNESKK